jgi:formylglycine-generating enzyme required for sulfatase activity
MGSNKKNDRMAYRPKIPQRQVCVDDFEIDNFEVTAREYLRFVVAGEPSSIAGLEIQWRKFSREYGSSPGYACFLKRGRCLLPVGRKAFTDGSGMGKSCEINRC